MNSLIKIFVSFALIVSSFGFFETKKVEAAPVEVTQPGTAQPEVTQPVAVQPVAAQLVAQPVSQAAAELEVAQPEVVQPEIVQPEAAQTTVQVVAQAAAAPSISGQAHVSNIGWMTPQNGYDGTTITIGTTGMSQSIEALALASPIGISYQSQVQNIGWMPVVSNGTITGTVGQGLRMEAIAIALSDTSNYEIQYRAYVQDHGWGPWVRNGDIVGTVGQSLRLEELQIRIVDKTTPLPDEDSMRVQLVKLSAIAYKPTNGYDAMNYTENNWKWVEDYSTSGGLQVKVYRKRYDSKYYYIFAFRGTTSGRDIIASDFAEVVLGGEINQVSSSVSYVNSIISRDRGIMDKVYFTGHSLGGYLAAWCESDLVDGIISVPNGSYCRTFNAPGTVDSWKIGRDHQYITSGVYDDYIKNYMISDTVYNWQTMSYEYRVVDLVSTWGDSLGKIVKCQTRDTFSDPFQYHDKQRFIDIINTANFPD